MESIGTTLMGTTFKDGVYFHMNVSTEKLRTAIDILIKILEDFEWGRESIEEEKRVVNKQIEFHYDTLYQEFKDIYLKNTPYERPIIGESSIIKKLENTQINSWKKKFFQCNNACFVLTGNFLERDRDYLITNIKTNKNTGDVVPVIQILPHGFCDRTQKTDYIIPSNQDLSNVRIHFDIALNKDLYFSARLLSSILGEGVGSRLALVLREKYALTDEVFSTIFLDRCSARMAIDFLVYNEDIEKSLMLCASEIKQLKKQVTKNDFLSAIPFFIENQKKQDDASDVNFYYGRNSFILGFPNIDLDYISNQYKSLTIPKLTEDANLLFTKENVSIYLQNNPKICSKKEIKKVLFKFREKI